MYVVCPEHLDQAIDEFVEVYEMPPDLYTPGQSVIYRLDRAAAL